MSGFASRLIGSSFLNRTGHAGPRRLLVLGGVAAGVLGIVAAVALTGSKPPLESHTARMPTVNPLPGGLNGNAQQSKLALMTDQAQADSAGQKGQSYTPPLAASASTHMIDDQPAVVASPEASPPPIKALPKPVVVAQYSPPPVSNATPQNSNSMIRPVSVTTPTDPAQQATDAKYVHDLLRGWDGRSPVTDIDIPQHSSGTDADDSGGRVRDADYSSPSRSSSAATTGAVLIPAGRGIFAHTVLAASTDSDGPIVLQADTGPLAGDRMIAAFSKASANGSTAADRMVVRVISVEHQGHVLSADGIVTAPDTMETTVASSVDEHYVSRFLLPAAAAFVQGLGTALETTSNTTSVASSLGGVESFTHLSLPQQLGVAAGTAAAQVGNTLNQEAPKGPTVHLDANANVGVMFLTPVTDAAR